MNSKEKEFGWTVASELDERARKLEAENEALKAENEALKAENEALKAENEALKAENEALRREIESLKAAQTPKPEEKKEPETEGKTPEPARKTVKKIEIEVSYNKHEDRFEICAPRIKNGFTFRLLIEEVKAAGFRFDGETKDWYAKNDKQGRKSVKKLTDYDIENFNFSWTKEAREAANAAIANGKK